MRKITILICFLIMSFDCYSQGKKGFQVLIGHENDVFSPFNNKDENYTGGFKLEVLTPQMGNFWQPFYRFKKEGFYNIQRFSFGGTGYTPQDLAASSIILNDRPYASLVYGSIGNTSFSSTNKWIIQTDLLFGFMGTKGPGKIQSYIHENQWLGSTRPVPLGWNNQIGFDGAFVMNYNTRLQYFISKIDTSKNFKLARTSVTGRIDLGNYMMNLQVGLKFDLFDINRNILVDYNPSYPTLVNKQSKIVRFNFFIEPQIRLAAYNATLEGLMFNDNSVFKISHNDVKRFLFELNTGVNLVLFDRIYLKYMVFARSREFQGGKPLHIWGGITFGFSPSFWNKH